MRACILTTICIFTCLFASASGIRAEGDPDPAGDRQIHLSPELLSLLRTEMREISRGIGKLAPSLAEADWESARETSEKISASYVMKQSLTPAQATELAHALPERFKRLDADFHHRAERLGAAAEAHDAELAVFHPERDNGLSSHILHPDRRTHP